MKYRHSFHVNVPIEDVARFHFQSASMAAITPPPIRVRIHHAPDSLGEGDEMAFTLWLGPLPLHWLAQIESVTATGFSDRQLTGPFGAWLHTHKFVQLSLKETVVIDEIEAQLLPHLLWRLVGLGMWLSLPILFAFRGWKTRRLLRATQNLTNVGLDS